MSRFEVGQQFTRKEIHEILGGGIETYLPAVSSKITAICVRLDMNPFAPDLIFVGSGGDVEERAELLLKQKGPVPFFLKEFSDRWKYIGDYHAVSANRDPKKIKEWAEIAGRPIRWALCLEKSK